MKTISTKYLPVVGGTITDIKVRLYYTAGDIPSKKGLYLSVTPVNRKVTDNGITIEGYAAYTGVKEFVLPMPRYSERKTFDFVIPSELEERMINHVLTKNGIQLM